MSDLSTLLRQHVDRTEPVLPPDPAAALDRGRRRLRTGRLVTAAVTTVVIGAAAALVVPRLVPDEGGPGRGIDPATQRALERYDAQQMPRILEQHVSDVLGRSVEDLPPADFYAGDDQGRRLEPAEYDRAGGMSVTYGAHADHRWVVSLSHSRSDAEGDARKNCASDLRAGTYLQCEVSTTEAGDVVTSRVWALRPISVNGGGGWAVVDRGRIDRRNPDRLWFSRSVKVVHSETFLTYAEEIVKAPDLATAETRFDVPVSDLVEIGTDPELVIPEPKHP